MSEVSNLCTMPNQITREMTMEVLKHHLQYPIIVNVDMNTLFLILMPKVAKQIGISTSEMKQHESELEDTILFAALVAQLTVAASNAIVSRYHVKETEILSHLPIIKTVVQEFLEEKMKTEV